MKKAAIEVDQEKRRVLFKRAVAKILDDAPVFLIGFTPRFFTLRTHVKGFVTNLNADFETWGGGLSHTWLDK
jgi:ABC-type transport system substrate-binding protein